MLFFKIYCQFFPCLPTVHFPQAHSDQVIQPLQLLSLGLALLRISVFSELLLSEHVVSLDLPRTLELPVPFSWDPFPISWVSCFPPSWFISMCWNSMFSSSFFGSKEDTAESIMKTALTMSTSSQTALVWTGYFSLPAAQRILKIPFASPPGFLFSITHISLSWFIPSFG